MSQSHISLYQTHHPRRTMKMILIILFFSALLSSTSLASSPVFSDFCVADLACPITPSGYPCKPTANVTVNDFVFSLLPATILSPYSFGFTTAIVKDIPGLNGLGISAARADIAENGVIPMHTHPNANEILIILEGQVFAGFITPTAVYAKTLKPGDLIVFPQGQLHFILNTGKGRVTAFAAYSSQNPGLQLLNGLLFANNLPSPIVASATFLDIPQIIKLKARFGGSG